MEDESRTKRLSLIDPQRRQRAESTDVAASCLPKENYLDRFNVDRCEQR